MTLQAALSHAPSAVFQTRQPEVHNVAVYVTMCVGGTVLLDAVLLSAVSFTLPTLLRDLVIPSPRTNSLIQFVIYLD